MSDFMSEDIRGRVRDNVFYDSYKEVVEFYSQEYEVQQWEAAATIVICDTKSDVGMFDHSDVICVYDKETFQPTIITERIFRKNYTWREWRGITKMLRLKAKHIKEELGFNIRISFASEYIDYVHFKEEWWQWAVKHAKG